MINEALNFIGQNLISMLTIALLIWAGNRYSKDIKRLLNKMFGTKSQKSKSKPSKKTEVLKTEKNCKEDIKTENENRSIQV